MRNCSIGSNSWSPSKRDRWGEAPGQWGQTPLVLAWAMGSDSIAFLESDPLQWSLTPLPSKPHSFEKLDSIEQEFRGVTLQHRCQSLEPAGEHQHTHHDQQHTGNTIHRAD